MKYLALGNRIQSELEVPSQPECRLRKAVWVVPVLPVACLVQDLPEQEYSGIRVRRDWVLHKQRRC